MSFMERMKNNRGKTAEAIKSSIKTGGFQKDDRIWKYGWLKHPTKKNKDGSQYCYSDSLIRFLPIPFVDMRKEEEGKLHDGAVLTPVVLVQTHDFKGPNGDRYNELSLSCLGQDCPVSEHDRPLWNKWKESGKPEGDVKKILVGRIAKDEFYSNILVIDDKANPENNGKVFLFKFGNAIKNMIDEAFEPSIPTKESFDPFDAFDGRDLHLQFGGEERSLGSWRGLVPVEMAKESSWVKSTLCGGDEAKIEEVMELAYSLQEFVDPIRFKTYAELKSRFMAVMGITEGESANHSMPDTNTVLNSTPSAPINDDGNTQQSNSASNVVHQQAQEADSSSLDDFERMLNEMEA